MKKKLSLVLCIMMSMMAVGCGSGQSSTEPKSEQTAVSEGERPSLKVGLISSISALPLLIAEDQGYFEADGVDVDIEYFKSASDRDAALQAGELDGVLCDETAIAIYQNADLNMQITGKTDGGFVLMAGGSTGIEKVEDLVGKKIAISQNTVIEYVLDQLLIQAGVDVSSVEKVSIPSMATRLELFMNGELDAALMPSPFSDTALANGAIALEQIESDSDLYISVTAFNQDVIDEKSEALVSYYKAYNEAVDYINGTDVSAYEDLIIDTIGYPEEMRGHIVAPTFNHNTLPTVSNVESVFEWCKEKGLLTKEIRPEEVLSHVGI